MSNVSETAFELRNASVYIDGKLILHRINWKVLRGERCFLLGTNGAGKTTLVKLLLGHLWPAEGGSVSTLGSVFGEGGDLVAMRRRVAWLSPLIASFSVGGLSGLELVLSGLDGTIGLFRKADPCEITEAKQLMRRFSCEALAERRLDSMSSGEQLRILICRALLPRPELLILDEPGVYLDLRGRELLLQELCRLAEEMPALTILHITQRTEDVLPLFCKGMLLSGGKVLAQGAREEILTEENLRALYGIPLKLKTDRSGRCWSYLE